MFQPGHLHAETGLSAPAILMESPHLDARYQRDPWSNRDGSYRYSLEVAGDAILPVGDDTQYLTFGGGFRLGAGYNLNRHIGAVLEYDFNDIGVNHAYAEQIVGRVASIVGQGNFTSQLHTWSITFNPVVPVVHHEGFGAYLIGGYGFYRKEVRYVIPANTDCVPYVTSVSQSCAERVLGRSSNNSGGLSIGAGVTQRLGLESKLHLFAELRYRWIDNQNSPKGTVSFVNTKTSYLPTVVGLKW